MNSVRVYTGTFTREGNKDGIYWYRFNPENGQLTFEGKKNAGPDPAFLTLTSDLKHLYTVNEVHEYQGTKGGGVSAFEVDPASGELTFLNALPTYGESPCYISLDETEKWALVSNYAGGSVTVYPVQEDGKLGPASEFIQHQGHGTDPDRQEKAHAHSIRMVPNNHVALAADLGLDQIKVYWMDLRTGKLHNDEDATIHMHPGAGPRHFDFHPNGRWMYVVDELDSTLGAFEIDPHTLHFIHLQTVSTLPAGYSGQKWAADIHVHPNGKLVFASNRAHESLAAFSIDPLSGKVTLIDVTPSGGKTPRNFAIDPSGKWLVAANQDSDNLVVFALDPESGKLTPQGEGVSLPMPVCLKFVVL
jgi:6-phosphogluconolactonase